VIDSSLFTDNANSKKPTCEIVENANNRFSRYCANPTTVPITSDNSDVVSSKFFQMFIVPSPKTVDRLSNGKLVSDPICSSSKKTKIEILGITVSHVVTIVGTPSYTSGAQLWNGAAATLNRNPTPIRSTPSTIPCEMFSCPTVDRLTEARL
jgi:hypothetical protein